MLIAEVSRKYGLTADTLRYYEKAGLLPGVKRLPNGMRDYSEENCRWIEFIKCMRGAGLSIEALAEYAALAQQGDGTAAARRSILLEQKNQLLQRLAAIQETLERLDYKIEHLNQCEQSLRDGGPRPR